MAVQLRKRCHDYRPQYGTGLESSLPGQHLWQIPAKKQYDQSVGIIVCWCYENKSKFSVRVSSPDFLCENNQTITILGMPTI